MLGNKVKVLRGQLDLSRKDLAENLNISYHALSKYETNEREPDIQTLKKIADYFNISIDDLLDRKVSKRELPENEKHVIRAHIPVLTRLTKDPDFVSIHDITKYDKILLLEPQLEGKFFWYIVEDHSLQSYRILKNDKILFIKTDELVDDSLVMLQIDDNDPVIRKIFCSDRYIMLTADSSMIKPITIDMDDYEKRLKIIARAIKVEFIP